MRRLLTFLLVVAFVGFANGCGEKVENKIASTPTKLPEGKGPVKAGGGPGGKAAVNKDEGPKAD